MVDKGIALIAEPHRMGAVHMIFRRSAGDLRGHIRPKRQCIALPVEKFVELPGTDRADLTAEDIEKFEGRGLDRMKAEAEHFLHQDLLQRKLPLAFIV